jgi:hypothetical protein
MAQPSRSSTTRAADGREPIMDMQPRGKLHIDPARIPPGTRYSWIRFSTLGQPDDENVSDMMQQGYRPVPADRHPELVAPPMPGREADTLVRRGGQILMEIPEDWALQREEYRRQQTQAVLLAVDKDRAAKADPTNFPALEPDIASKTERRTGNVKTFDE